MCCPATSRDETIADAAAKVKVRSLAETGQYGVNAVRSWCVPANNELL